MNNRSPARVVSLLLSLATLSIAAPACGKVKDGLSSTKDSVTETAKEAAEKTDNWINEEPMRQRRRQCDKEGGKWAEKVTVSACEYGKVKLTIDGKSEHQDCNAGEGGEADGQCVHVNEDGASYYNDGPSVPHLLQRLSGTLHGDIDQLRYLELFWPAGVNHDYCYHHGALVYDADQAECDSQYFSDLSAVCANEAFRADNPWFKQRSCRQVAATHFVAVRAQGEGAYKQLQSYVVYPAWVPMWQTLGLPEDVVDEELMKTIEEKLDMLNLLPADG